VAVVRLPAVLAERAGGRQLVVDGDTVRDVLRRLEREQPPLAGWILDERGRIREHVNVFVNGERGWEETALADTDTLHVVPSISGG
jgi:molybdopterin converting factor small subunit